MERYIHWLWALLFCFHISCTNFNPCDITPDEEPWGANVAMKRDVETIGSINGVPALRLRGNISKNIPGKGVAVLCALFVPTNGVLSDCTQAIKSHHVRAEGQEASSGAVSVQALHALSDGSFVYYDRQLTPNQEGDVALLVASLALDHGLALDTKYKVYLGIKVADHFYYDEDEYRQYATPTIGSLTTVHITSDPQCAYTYDASGKLKLQLSMAATTTTNHQPTTNDNTGNDNSGFLLIKRGTDLTAVDVLGEHLLDKKGLPTAPNVFVGLRDNGNVVYCATDSLNPDAFQITDVDPEETLTKGGVYDVYGCIQRGVDYFVSGAKPIELPEVEIKVSMGRVGDLKILCVHDNHGNGNASHQLRKFDLDVQGTIDRLEHAKNPVAGFVIVQEHANKMPEAICQAIKDAGSALKAQGDITEQDDCIVGLLAQNNVGVGAISYTYDLENLTNDSVLDEEYKGYFWVHNAPLEGGEVFLSDAKTLEIPYVALPKKISVDFIRTDNRATITPTVENSPSDTSPGVVFDFFWLNWHNSHLHNFDPYIEQLANNVCAADAAHQSDQGRPLSPSGFVSTVNPYTDNRSVWHIGTSRTPSFTRSLHADIVQADVGATRGVLAGGNYRLYLLAYKQSALYVMPGAEYDVPEFLESEDVRQIPMLGGTKVSINFTRRVAHCFKQDDSLGRRLDPQNPSDAATIREAIEQYTTNPSERGKKFSDFGV